MPTSYTSLLGFALPVTGELQGTWGTVVNDNITELVEDSIAATATASVTSGNWTLSTTGSGAANEARCAILIPTGTPGVSRNIVAPSQSKAYIVINQSDAAVVVKGSATTGTTIAAGDRAVVAWNGSDFVTIASTATDGVATISFGTTGLTPSTATSGAVTVAGTLAVANGGTGQTTYTDGQLLIGNSTGNTLAKSTLTAGSGVSITNGSGSITISATGSGGDAVLANNNAFTGANTFYNNTGQTIGTGTSTQDGLILAGRAGGSSSFRITLQPATLSASRTLTLPEPGENVTLGYLNIPQNSQSAAYTLVLTDAGKQIFHPSADTTARTFTIPANSSVAYPVGTAITFINQNGAGVITIAITSDTMRLAGAGTTGSRTLAANGIATCVKVTSTEWIISGTGLT